MNVLIIFLILICIIEAIVIFLLLKKKNKSVELQDKKTIPYYIVEAFKKNNYNIKNLDINDFESNLRMFILQIQNQEYKRAEYRVFEKFDIFLNELWRLKKEENNKLASNLLILLKNTLLIEFEDIQKIKYTPNIKNKYQIVSEVKENDTLLIIKPVWLVKGKVVIKGKARRLQ